MFPLSSVYLLFLLIILRLVIWGREGERRKKGRKKGVSSLAAHSLNLNTTHTRYTLEKPGSYTTISVTASLG